MEAGPPQELIAMAYGRIAAWHALNVLDPKGRFVGGPRGKAPMRRRCTAGA